MVFSAKRMVFLSIEIPGDRAERAPAHRLRRSPPDRPPRRLRLPRRGWFPGSRAIPEGISPTVAGAAPD
jgi:hypothetical protein